jgi:cobalamin biosynthesis protein CobD/CbiB
VRYGERVEHRPLLGRGRTVEAGDIQRAVQLSDDVTMALVAALAVLRR